MAPPNAAFRVGVDRVRILGAKLTLDMREALLSAKLDVGMDQITQLSLDFVDPGWFALNRGAGVLGTRVDLDDFALHIAAVETKSVNGAEGFTLQCRPILVSNLKNRRGAKVMTNVSPSDFVLTEAKAAGFTNWTIQPSPKRKQIARDVVEKGQSYDPNSIPSSWTTFQRLASELGYVCFEVAGWLHFGKPSWLLSRSGVTTVQAGYLTGLDQNRVIDVPICRKTFDSKQTTLDLSAAGVDGFIYLPGRKLVFSGVSGFNGSYLLSGASYDLQNPSGTVDFQAETPLDPQPNPPSTSTPSSGGSSSGGSGGNTSSGTRRNTRLAGDFVYWAQRQLGDRYVFGAPVSKSTNPNEFDCSSLVKWAASMVGVYMPRTSEEQINYCTNHNTRISVSSAKRIRGALLWHPGHVAISLGNGRTIEAANSRVGVISSDIGSRFTRAAKLPSMRY